MEIGIILNKHNRPIYQMMFKCVVAGFKKHNIPVHIFEGLDKQSQYLSRHFDLVIVFNNVFAKINPILQRQKASGSKFLTLYASPIQQHELLT